MALGACVEADVSPRHPTSTWALSRARSLSEAYFNRWRSLTRARLLPPSLCGLTSYLHRRWASRRSTWAHPSSSRSRCVGGRGVGDGGEQGMHRAAVECQLRGRDALQATVLQHADVPYCLFGAPYLKRSRPCLPPYQCRLPYPAPLVPVSPPSRPPAGRCVRRPRRRRPPRLLRAGRARHPRAPATAVRGRAGCALRSAGHQVGRIV